MLIGQLKNRLPKGIHDRIQSPLWIHAHPSLTAWMKKIPEIATVLEACKRAGIPASHPDFMQILLKESQGIEDERIELARTQIARQYIRGKIGDRNPQILLTLGSGLSSLGGKITDQIYVNYDEIPGFPRPGRSVPGHAGRLIFGKLNGVDVVAMDGRFHLYQGLTTTQVVRPVRTIMFLADIRYFIVTNAAGGAYEGVEKGTPAIITDQIDNTGESLPLLPGYPIFSDMSKAYSKTLQAMVKDIAAGRQTKIAEAVYQQNRGPKYETPAEVRAGVLSGSELFGMSTGKEVEAVCQQNALLKQLNEARGKAKRKLFPLIEVIGLTFITNKAAGVDPDACLSHGEVTAAGKDEDLSAPFVDLVKNVVSELGLKLAA